MILRDAQHMAEEVRAAIAPLSAIGDNNKPLCFVAGSVRRLKPDLIKDVEIVFVPNNARLFDLIEIINHKWGEPAIGKFPSKYTRIRGRYNIDIFCCSRDTIGLNYFIRTGSDSFVRRALAEWKKKTGGGYSQDDQLRDRHGNIVPTPSEQHVFAALGWRFVNPELRV